MPGVLRVTMQYPSGDKVAWVTDPLTAKLLFRLATHDVGGGSAEALAKYLIHGGKLFSAIVKAVRMLLDKELDRFTTACCGAQTVHAMLSHRLPDHEGLWFKLAPTLSQLMRELCHPVSHTTDPSVTVAGRTHTPWT